MGEERRKRLRDDLEKQAREAEESEVGYQVWPLADVAAFEAEREEYEADRHEGYCEDCGPECCCGRIL